MVLRKISLLAAFAGILAPWTPAHAQEQPSLADLVRAAHEDKEKNTVPAKTPRMILGPAAALRRAPPIHTAGNRLRAICPIAPPGPAATAIQWRRPGWGIDRASVSPDKMEPLDRASPAKVVLEGNDVDFPNRSNWEERLFAAKQAYVARSRQLLGEMQKLMTSAQSLPSSQGVASKLMPETPQAQELIVRAQATAARSDEHRGCFQSPPSGRPGIRETRVSRQLSPLVHTRIRRSLDRLILRWQHGMGHSRGHQSRVEGNPFHRKKCRSGSSASATEFRPGGATRPFHPRAVRRRMPEVRFMGRGKDFRAAWR
jgi:hypothetical protein